MSEPSSIVPALLCLRGAQAPSDLASNLHVLATFSPDARRQLWGVLGPSLAQPADPQAEEASRAFSERHGVAPADLKRALRACRFLLRAAAKTDLSLESFESDLAVLFPTGSTPDDLATQTSVALRQLLRIGYPAAMASLRREIVIGSLADHGRVLLKVDWRVDRVLSSERGELGAQVAVLTLHVQEGTNQERITLQALPEEVRALRDLCDRLLK